jgi:16S rRNA (uracil1498-N3)-methyltransferase
MDRLEKIIRTAGKQSANPNFPKLNGLISFEELMNDSTEKNKFIAHLDSSSKGHFFDVIPQGEDVLILIGPEGDFTEKEVETARAHGFLSVHFGENRLRTETAGIFATQCLILKNK